VPIAFQDLLDAESTCFGCGPANPQGFRLKSHWADDRSAVVATHVVEPFHGSGFPNTLQGGALATLLDCHLCWAVIAWAYTDEGREVGTGDRIIYVTAELSLRYLRPTPIDVPLQLRAHVEGPVGRKMRAVGEIGDGTTVTATAEGRFVRVV
jgi:acyl-coenzyme A thioesterase PaaI-like protein